MTLRDLVALRKLEYSKLKSVQCPLLKEDVLFNNQGFRHLTHDGRGHLRSATVQKMRLNLLTDVCEVIKKADALGAPDRIVPARHPENRLAKEVCYHELYYRFHSRKAVAVILRRIGGGQLHFYSVRYVKKAKTPKKAT
ncbi:hypothetical protein FWG76_00270 [Candidatus Saccharibacteria bacterium]|nr:hypothetical protein [Candidatus Saccharibacteria bacterium]